MTVIAAEFAADAPAALLQVSEYVAVPTVAGVTVCVPLVATLPLQLPDAVQLFALNEDHVRVVVLPVATEDAADEIAGAPGGIKAMALSAWTNPNPEVTL